MDRGVHWFPGTNPGRRPSPWWYVGWVIYANLWSFAVASGLFAGVGRLAFSIGRRFGFDALVWGSYVLAVAGTFLLINSLVGLVLVYGAPARRYVGRLLEMGGVRSPERVADLHIGTYRISYLLRDLLPSATIESVDIWEDGRYEIEPTLKLLRDLESAPADNARLHVKRTGSGNVPLSDACCDAVVLGLGLHEIPSGAPREQIFAEARRILKPDGKLLFFEHTVDLQSLLVFGPGISHWVRRPEWLRIIAQTFGDGVQHSRSPEAIDLFVAARGD